MKKYLNIVLAICSVYFTSCKKAWLDQKPDSRLVVLSSLSDYQTLLDNNKMYTLASPASEIGTDNYYLTPAFLKSSVIQNIAQYTWALNGYQSPSGSAVDWSSPYSCIYSSNTVLAGLKKIDRDVSNNSQWDQVYGSALFFRAFYYYELAQVFTKPYDATTAKTDLGVPLRLDPDISKIADRGTVQQTYDQILNDLNAAIATLPIAGSTYLTRPNKAAGFALLSRIYLSMDNYTSSLATADSALKYHNTLLDYNTLATPLANATFGMPPFTQNPEVFYEVNISTFLLGQSVAAIDTVLFKSYTTNDLRKTRFFNTATYAPSVSFIGSYDGENSSYLFAAPAVDELYLNRAECYARLGNVNLAMNDLNTLLIKRWKQGTFVPLSATNADNALSQILTERRKELVMRGTRWADLRRLNKDPKYATTLTRIVSGQTFTLTPNSNSYAWPIPDNEILYSGIQQNPK